MAVYPFLDMATIPAYKRQRRTATSVLAGDFDYRTPRERDVLTSVLNGVPKYPLVEKVEEDEERRARKRERKEREHAKKRPKPAPKPADKARPPLPTASASTSTALPPAASRLSPTPRASNTPSSFWQARPAINIVAGQRSVSVTPPPMPSSPPDTPGPSTSSVTSRTSSKRPRTPGDDEDFDDRGRSRSHSVMSSTPPLTTSAPVVPRPRKRRAAARKGWKGWVEGSPPPSDKLINLDSVTVLTERTTRSGKSFDAVGPGEQKDFWI